MNTNIHSTDLDELMSITEVLAQLKNVHRSTFYRWRSTGRGPKSTRLPNGQIRIKRADLLDWLDGLTT